MIYTCSGRGYVPIRLYLQKQGNRLNLAQEPVVCWPLTLNNTYAQFLWIQRKYCHPSLFVYKSIFTYIVSFASHNLRFNRAYVAPLFIQMLTQCAFHCNNGVKIISRNCICFLILLHVLEAAVIFIIFVSIFRKLHIDLWSVSSHWYSIVTCRWILWIYRIIVFICLLHILG